MKAILLSLLFLSSTAFAGEAFYNLNVNTNIKINKGNSNSLIFHVEKDGTLRDYGYKAYKQSGDKSQKCSFMFFHEGIDRSNAINKHDVLLGGKDLLLVDTLSQYNEDGTVSILELEDHDGVRLGVATCSNGNKSMSVEEALLTLENIFSIRKL